MEQTEIVQQSRIDFLRDFFLVLESHHVNYCVLHAYDKLRRRQTGDIDLCIDRPGYKIIDKILSEVAARHKFVIVQKIHYDVPFCYYYVLARITAHRVVTIQLDFLYDNIGINRYYLTSNVLLNTRRKYNGFYIPAPALEAVYVWVKKNVKGRMSREHINNLKNLYKEDSGGVEKTIATYFGRKRREGMRNLILSDDLSVGKPPARMQYPNLSVSFGLPQVIQKVLYEINRIFHRVANPTGMSIAILSPDGGGKTTVARELLQRLRKCFRRNEYLHWRPSLLPEMNDLIRSRHGLSYRSSGPSSHTRSPQNSAKSYIRFFYYLFDFLLGHFKVKYLKIKTSIIIFDRYYYDYFFDPYRYHFCYQRNLIRGFLPIIPKPDLVFYLDCDTMTLLKRKQEISKVELERQIKSAKVLRSVIPDCRFVNTENRSIDDVVSEIAQVILMKKAAQTEKLLNIR